MFAIPTGRVAECRAQHIRAIVDQGDVARISRCLVENFERIARIKARARIRDEMVIADDFLWKLSDFIMQIHQIS